MCTLKMFSIKNRVTRFSLMCTLKMFSIKNRVTRISQMCTLKMLYIKMYFDFIQFLVILIGHLLLRTIATFIYQTSYCYLTLKFGYRFTNVIGRDK